MPDSTRTTDPAAAPADASAATDPSARPAAAAADLAEAASQGPGLRLREPLPPGALAGDLLAAQAACDRAAALPADAALLARATALLERATTEARAGRMPAATDALDLLARELAATLSADERAACAETALAELAAQPDWRAPLAARLARPERDGAIGVAALTALLGQLHAVRRERRLARQTNARQIPAAAGLLAFAALFFTLWALAGGFDWLTHQDYEVTPGMWLVTGVLFGFVGGVASVALRLLGGAGSATRTPAALRWPALTTLARPLVGAVLAVPVVLFTNAGLLAVGDVAPVAIFALCFAAGFAERVFARQAERLAAL